MIQPKFEAKNAIDERRIPWQSQKETPTIPSARKSRLLSLSFALNPAERNAQTERTNTIFEGRATKPQVMRASQNEPKETTRSRYSRLTASPLSSGISCSFAAQAFFVLFPADCRAKDRLLSIYEKLEPVLSAEKPHPVPSARKHAAGTKRGKTCKRYCPDFSPWLV